MAKILISDLYGTLIPGWIEEMEYYYGSGDKAGGKNWYEIFENEEYSEKLIDKVFIHLSNYLERYLSEGNYLYLVTTCDSHDGTGFIFEKIINRLCRENEKYKSQIFIFLAGVIGNDNEIADLASVAKITEKDGTFYAENKDGVIATLLDEKTEIFDFIKRSHNLSEDELYTIGDHARDIPMLLECINLGGQSSLIENGFYRTNPTTEDIIHQAVQRQFYLNIEDFIPGYNNMSSSERINAMFYDKAFGEQHTKWYRSQLQALYEQLRNGEINLDDLRKQESVYTTMKSYNDIFNKKEPVEITNQILTSLAVYPTFSDYCGKVLIKK